MANTLKCDYESRLPLLGNLAGNLEQEAVGAVSALPHVDRIYFRVKPVMSFLEKATDPTTEPPYEDPLVDIEDQVAGRILVFFVGDVQPVKSALEGTFNAIEYKHKRPRKDEEFGYESHHLIYVIPPQAKPEGWQGTKNLPTTFEVQIRTLFMHAWAEPQHNIDYKAAGDLPPDVRKELFWIAASAWGADQAYERVLNWQRRKK